MYSQLCVLKYTDSNDKSTQQARQSEVVVLACTHMHRDIMGMVTLTVKLRNVAGWLLES